MTYKDNQSASTPRVATPYLENRERNPISLKYTSQIYLHKDPYQLQNKNEIMTRTNMRNPEEDHFNESLLTLLNRQQDLQKTVIQHDAKHDM